MAGMQEHGNVRAQFFLYINICRNIYIGTLYALQNKRERETIGGIAWGSSNLRRVEYQTSKPTTGNRQMFLSQKQRNICLWPGNITYVPRPTEEHILTNIRPHGHLGRGT
jgi:hypothetical protein